MRILSDFYSQTTTSKKRRGEVFSTLKENIASLEFCIEQNYPSQVRRSKDFTKETKTDSGQWICPVTRILQREGKCLSLDLDLSRDKERRSPRRDPPGCGALSRTGW